MHLSLFLHISSLVLTKNIVALIWFSYSYAMGFGIRLVFNLSLRQLLVVDRVDNLLQEKQLYTDSSNQLYLLGNSVALETSLHVTIKWQNFR